MTNRTTKHKGLKSIITLMLIFMMTFALALTTACNKGGDDSSSTGDSSSTTTTTTTDTNAIVNGSFEYYGEDDDITFPYKTSIKWSTNRDSIVSSSDYAPSSDGASGIIDVSGALRTRLKAISAGGCA